MNPETLLVLGREALLVMVLMSLPPILASFAVGFVVSLLQAMTQIQDSTLLVVPKLAASVIALVLAAPFISSQLVRFAEQLLLALPEVGL